MNLSLAILQAGHRFEVTGAHVAMLVISTVVVGVCVLFHYETMSISSRLLPRLRIRRRARIVGLIATMMVAHVIEVWIFALCYWVLERHPELGGFEGGFEEGALDLVYFSATTFTTLGFGDIVPKGPMRILVGTEGLVGLGLVTWSASLGFLEMQRDWAEYRPK